MWHGQILLCDCESRHLVWYGRNSYIEERTESIHSFSDILTIIEIQDDFSIPNKVFIMSFERPVCSLMLIEFLHTFYCVKWELNITFQTVIKKFLSNYNKRIIFKIYSIVFRSQQKLSKVCKLQLFYQLCGWHCFCTDYCSMRIFLQIRIF